jgi:hypothetical protein
VNRVIFHSESEEFMSDKPVHEIRLGKIKAAVWRNDTEEGARYNVTIQRIYRTDQGWQNTSSFGRDDLPLVSKVADMTHTWIFEQRSEREEGREQATAPARQEQSPRSKRERTPSR